MFLLGLTLSQELFVTPLPKMIEEACKNEKILPYNKIFIYTAEHPGVGYNWNHLMKNQEKWRERFGDRRAYPNPDYGGNYSE